MTDQAEDIENRPPHTAITSYSGYIYQGKIAVLHCLKLIKEQPACCRVLSLQIESIDDFAILNEDGSCKSLHQVKARKTTRFTDYQSDVVKQVDKAGNYEGADAFFHVSLPLRGIPDDFEAMNLPVRFYQYINTNGEEVTYCKLKEVDDFIEYRIRQVYEILFPTEEYRTESNYLIKSRQYLEDVVIKHVIDIHNEVVENTIQGRTDRVIAAQAQISFNCFYRCLSEDLNNIEEDDSYFHCLLLKDAGSYFQDYCYKNISDEKILIKMNYYLLKINQLDVGELTNFVRSILPNKKVGFSNIRQYKDYSFNRDDFRIGLLKVFEQLVESDFDDSSKIPSLFFWKKDDEYFYPTAIYRTLEDAEELSMDIIEASIEDDVDFLYESGKLINRHISKDSIFSSIAVGSHSEYELEAEYEGGLDSNRINSFRNVSLISLKDAKEIINE